jgi:hypothetical protein
VIRDHQWYEDLKVYDAHVRERADDTDALIRLSRYLSEHGQRDRDPSSVGAVIAWCEELRAQVEELTPKGCWVHPHTVGTGLPL